MTIMVCSSTFLEFGCGDAEYAQVPRHIIDGLVLSDGTVLSLEEREDDGPRLILFRDHRQ
mgnify:CR=1 FL=1